MSSYDVYVIPPAKLLPRKGNAPMQGDGKAEPAFRILKEGTLDEATEAIDKAKRRYKGRKFNIQPVLNP